MDLRVLMVAVLFVQSVLPAPMCAGPACAMASAMCAPEAECTASCAPLIRPSECCIVRCEAAPARGGDEAPCRPVCVPCPLGQPLAPTQSPTQPTPPEIAQLPDPLGFEVQPPAPVAPIASQQVSSLVTPGFRSLLCVWII